MPSAIIHLIQQLYDNAACQVIHNEKLTESFKVRTGVGQGCLLSPMIFLIAADWIMRQTAGNEETGIKWTHTKNLEDLNFADDDICLISHKLEDIQVKSNKLAIEEASKIGLQVNIEKTEVMKIPGQHRQQQQQQSTGVNGRNRKERTSFTYLPAYLESILSTTGGRN
uniref:Reverse transcriptase domain-containing protein n=1 Tax=Trichobilharzia regenti TaxID=157069 RepID=A0AA85IM80_TRIRE|nr:unnamed protein product [Trichobilharzia regenti]